MSVERPATPDAAAPRRDPVDSSTRRRIAGYAIGGALALVPVARMIDIVIDGSALQYADYWQMLGRFANPDGSLDPGGLFHFQNEHPVVVPQLIYWLNVRLFSGSNIALGLVVVALVLGQLAVVALLLRRSALCPVERIAIFVLASALLFDLTGTWNFSKAMSGTAWFSANLFAITAVYLRSRDRCAPAFGVAILAAISYGTGAVAWVAVIATGMSRRPVRQWWREWPYAVGLVVTVVWYRLSGPSVERGSSDPLAIVRLAARVLGSVLGTHGDLAELIGYVALIGVPVLVVRVGIFSRTAGVAGWVGVATFGWLATLEICAGRGVALVTLGGTNRYSSLAALAWLGFASLLLYALRDVGHRLATRRSRASASVVASPWVSVALIAPLLFGAMTAGRAHADEMLDLKRGQELGEIALRLGLTNDTRYVVGPFGANLDPTSSDLLIELDHYPFVGGWALDCGLHGQHLDDVGGDDARAIEGRLLSGEPARWLPGAVEITGYLIVDDPVRCVVITNDAGEVVGAATVGVDDLAATGRIPPDAIGFRALASSGGTDYRVYAILEGGTDPLFVDDLPAGEGGAG